jgi:hypothetical protein
MERELGVKEETLEEVRTRVTEVAVLFEKKEI